MAKKTEFIIASFLSSLDDENLAKMKRCGFNALFTQPAGTDARPDSLTIGDLLNRLRKLGGMKAFVSDSRLGWAPPVRAMVDPPGDDDFLEEQEFPTSYSRGDVDGLPSAEYLLARYKKMPQEIKEMILAYYIADEPRQHIGFPPGTTAPFKAKKLWWDSHAALGSYTTNGSLSQYWHQMMLHGGDKTAHVVLMKKTGALGFDTFHDWSLEYTENLLNDAPYTSLGYDAYLDDYFAHYDDYLTDARPFYVGTDYYPFNVFRATQEEHPRWSDLAPADVNGFTALGGWNGPGQKQNYAFLVYYFKQLSALAVRTREKRAAGIDLRMLAACLSVQSWFIPVDMPFPNGNRLRYELYTNLSYGVKGVQWFTYGMPPSGELDDGHPGNDGLYYHSPETNDELYRTLMMVNDEAKWIGNVLAGIEWQEAIHGASTDPESEEPNLRTLEDSRIAPTALGELLSNEIEDFSSAPSLLISHFRHLKTGHDYLLIFNKSGAAHYYKRDTEAVLERIEGELQAYYNAGAMLSAFPLKIQGFRSIRMKFKHGQGWSKMETSYDAGENITTVNLSLKTSEGILLSLAAGNP